MGDCCIVLCIVVLGCALLASALHFGPRPFTFHARPVGLSLPCSIYLSSHRVTLFAPCARRARVAMALSKLSEDQHRSVFTHL